MEGISVIFPARNENNSMAVILPFLFAVSNTAAEVIVILDTVEDDTWNLSKIELGDSRPVHFVLNSGVGVLGAIQTGVNFSSCNYSVICAADEYLPTLVIDEIYIHLESGIDFVSGTRYSKGGKRYGGRFVGKSISFLVNVFLRLRFRNGMTDFTTGIKAFRNLHFEKLIVGANSVGWSCALTFALNASRLKLPIREVPIISVDRVFGGSSTFQLKKWVFGYLNAIKNFAKLKSVQNE